ncbi:hypothetical protein K438DRAFT_1976201 [Mycena galopus ATCC 62051]|nr:hypothetical protein K438DRAFT_1976201 [Mycena galopus ATCC 62051]
MIPFSALLPTMSASLSSSTTSTVGPHRRSTPLFTSPSTPTSTSSSIVAKLGLHRHFPSALIALTSPIGTASTPSLSPVTLSSPSATDTPLVSHSIKTAAPMSATTATVSSRLHVAAISLFTAAGIETRLAGGIANNRPPVEASRLAALRAASVPTLLSAGFWFSNRAVLPFASNVTTSLFMSCTAPNAACNGFPNNTSQPPRCRKPRTHMFPARPRSLLRPPNVQIPPLPSRPPFSSASWGHSIAPFSSPATRKTSCRSLLPQRRYPMSPSPSLSPLSVHPARSNV